MPAGKRAECESRKTSWTIAVVQARDDYSVDMGRGQKWRDTEHTLVIEARACLVGCKE